MKSISSLSNIHKMGVYGDYYEKEESNLIKIKEIKNISLYQIVKYKNSKQDISDFKIHGVNFPVSLKTSSNQSTRILWMGPDNWYVFSTLDIFEDLKAFDDKDFAITNISQSRTVIELEGDSINEVLKYQPKEIQIAVLIERYYKNFPIVPNFRGLELSTSKSEHVKVELKDSPKVLII